MGNLNGFGDFAVKFDISVADFEGKKVKQNPLTLHV